jgi:hypothetical protein
MDLFDRYWECFPYNGHNDHEDGPELPDRAGYWDTHRLFRKLLGISILYHSTLRSCSLINNDVHPIFALHDSFAGYNSFAEC